jgi:hypothetical protein
MLRNLNGGEHYAVGESSWVLSILRRLGLIRMC